MSMLIDGTAGTMITGYDGNEETTDFLRYDVTNLGYYGLDEGSETAVIGVGGGRDVLSALEFDVDRVTGIEINTNILDIVTNELGDFTNLEGNERVRLVNDEARSWLTRTEDEFDMIQMSLIDTWAASLGGRLRPVRELALHDRLVEHVLRPHRRRRDALGVPPGTRSAASEAVSRRCGTALARRPRCSPSAASRTRVTTC